MSVARSTRRAALLTAWLVLYSACPPPPASPKAPTTEETQWTQAPDDDPIVDPPNLASAGSLECLEGARRRAHHAAYGSRCVNVDGLMHGAFVQLDAEGRYRVVGHYRLGLRHGRWTLFYPSGMLSEQREFEGNQLTGVEKFWYPDGQLRLRREYAQGKTHGVTRYYSPTGELMGEARYDQGQFVPAEDPDRPQSPSPSPSPLPAQEHSPEPEPEPEPENGIGYARPDTGQGG